MATQVSLRAKKRTELGKGPVKRLRRRGVVPGVMYGRNTEPVPLVVGLDELGDVLAHASSGNVLVNLTLDSGGQISQHLALIQEVQHHPVRDEVLHVDFREVRATEKMRTTVAVRPVGEPVGVKSGGGTLEFVLRELRIECLPHDLPDVIEVNVEALGVGQSLNVGQITPPPGVVLLDPKDRPVFTVVAPEAEEVPVAAEAGPAEPEVITEKKAEAEAAGEGAEAKPEAAKPEAKPAAAKGETKSAAAAPQQPAAKPEPKKK
ncbi:MAG: 50S ribosomal protein L25 [Verrucomicrobiae bacterium]|nr:50S ribosomal protein L25 [Verrucomicrobiae bacterium]